MRRSIGLFIWSYIFLFTKYLGSVPIDSSKATLIKNSDKSSELASFWSMAQLGGNIGYVIMGVLAIGLFLIFLRVVDLVIDYFRSRTLAQIDFQKQKLTDIERLAKEKADSILGQLINHLIEFYKATNTAQFMQQELQAVLEMENEKFEAFRNRLYFLSDSAGALGLLGTVWGVFLTFFGGSLDSEKILNGMGVALITTLLGLVVSLIINFFGTEIYSVFQKRIDSVAKKGDELRLFLLQASGFDSGNAPLVLENEVPVVNSQLEKESDNFEVKFEEIETPPPVLTVGQSYTLRFKVLTTSGQMPEDLKLSLKSSGEISFPFGSKSLELDMKNTDDFSIKIEAGKKVGEGLINIFLSNYNKFDHSLKFKIACGKPSSLKILGSEDLVGKVNEALPEQLRIKILDEFQNPVSNIKVQFELTMGEGKFKETGKSICVKETDTEGIAVTEFVLGNRTGFHTIQAKVIDENIDPVEFRILSKQK